MADTEVFADIETVHAAVPVQAAPLQPVNTYPAAGAGVSVTLVPLLNAAEQLAPHAIPAGLDATEPPEPEFVTASV